MILAPYRQPPKEAQAVLASCRSQNRLVQDALNSGDVNAMARLASDIAARRTLLT